MTLAVDANGSSSSNSNNERDIINLGGTGDDSTTRPEKLHQLPCSVDYDGPAKTSTYFLPEKQPDLTYSASFRGRQLCGRKVTLPDSYIGHVVVESTACNHGLPDVAFESDLPPSSPTANAQRELRSVAQFEDLTVWDHDQMPLLEDDEFLCALQWIEVAGCIHADCSSNPIATMDK
ncbi:hypothetical protein H4S06_005992 [Coemansia sp. BCRC 34490]|nr:hypothetical protein H4S06_005992 [Coemansia sp. BCRC 34490]